MTTRSIIKPIIKSIIKPIVKTGGVGGGSPPAATGVLYDYEQAAPPAGTFTGWEDNFGASIVAGAGFNSSAGLSITTTGFSQRHIYNASLANLFIMPVNQGSIRCRFKYDGAWPANMMLFQVDGKSTGDPWDTNDAIKVLFRTTNGQLRVSWGGAGGAVTVFATQTGTMSAGNWYTVIVRYCTDAGITTPFVNISLNGATPSSVASPTPTNCTVWHHQSQGNDLAINTAAFVIDELELRNTHNHVFS